MVAFLFMTAVVLPHHMPVRFWLHTAAIALLVMLAYDLASQASPEGSYFGSGLFTERLIDVLVGCAMALVVTPKSASSGASAPRRKRRSDPPAEPERRPVALLRVIPT